MKTAKKGDDKDRNEILITKEKPRERLNILMFGLRMREKDKYIDVFKY